MLKRLPVILLVFSLCLSGCGNASPEAPSGDTPADASSSGGSSSSEALDYEAMLATEGTIDDPWVTEGLFIPPVAEGVTATKRETYKLCEGTVMETEVVLLTADQPGEAIYIIAGIHGDEVAAWQAANRLKEMELAAGKLYILSPANAAGARDISRHVVPGQDGNRAFPGDPAGTEAEQLAHAIYTDVEAAAPALVFDLHEAIVVAQNRDFLGSSLIYTDLAGMEDFFLDLFMATQARELCSEAFNYHGPGPEGSVNSNITKGLGIPAITVETYRGYVLERRIEDQMAIVGYALRYYGLVA